MCCALLFQRQQPALDGTNRCTTDITVLILEGFGVIADVLGNCPQIFKVEQQQSLIVSNAENDIQHARLHIVEIQQSCQQQRPQIRNRRPHRMAFLAKDIPHHHRISMRLPVIYADIFKPCEQFFRRCTFLRNSR
ncbi:hypothetical protein ExPCM15_01760 [Escherichia coli]|nr:hypothetical protein ExPCM15_01760 [Escherichia coli]